MTHLDPRRFLILPIALTLAVLSTACVGPSRAMQPQLSAAGAAAEAQTDCAGDVCFTYTKQR